MSNRPPVTFALAVLGCRANQEEVEALRSHLLAGGAREVPYPGPADMVVVNTCAVTASAQAQSRQAVRRAGRCAPGLLVVTGCGAQLAPHEFAALPGVGWVVGNGVKGSILDELYARLRGDGREESTARREPVSVSWTSDPTVSGFLRQAGPVPHRRARALLKIQDGCDLGCAYCIVPRVRGRPVSRDPEEVLAEAQRLVEAGWREIVLTGIHLGLYGQEAHPQAGADPLVALLQRLERVPGLGRIRLSSLEPMAITDSLLDCLASTDRICSHLHVPLQSGDDEVLRRMARPYDAATFRARLERIRHALPRAGLGVDVLAGFPGESERAFAATVGLIEELPVTYLHAFAFSPRPGTRAADLVGQVEAPVRRERVRRLRALDPRLRRRFHRRLKGEPAVVLVERARDGHFEGLTGEFVRVRGRSERAAVGELMEVVLGEPCGTTVVEAHPV